MRCCFIGLLLTGFFSAQAVAQEDVSADSVFERLCQDAGYESGSGEFEQCMKNSHNNLRAQESGNGFPVQEKNIGHDSSDRENPTDNKSTANTAKNESNGKMTAEAYCATFDYVRGSDSYDQCISYALENGYAIAVDAQKAQTAGRRKKARIN